MSKHDRTRASGRENGRCQVQVVLPQEVVDALAAAYPGEPMATAAFRAIAYRLDLQVEPPKRTGKAGSPDRSAEHDTDPVHMLTGSQEADVAHDEERREPH